MNKESPEEKRERMRQSELKRYRNNHFSTTFRIHCIHLFFQLKNAC